MKRLAPLALILLLVLCTTGCRRGLRLWGLRGAPCQPAGAAAPGLGGGPFAGGVLGGAPQMPMAAPMASPTCCPPADCCPPVECGCATGGLPMDPAYAGTGGGQIPMGGMLANGTEIPLSDPGFDVRPGETFGGVVGGTDLGGIGGTANVAPPMPANLPPTLPLQ